MAYNIESEFIIKIQSDYIIENTINPQTLGAVAYFI